MVVVPTRLSPSAGAMMVTSGGVISSPGQPARRTAVKNAKR
jgi:hypothetical protein